MYLKGHWRSLLCLKTFALLITLMPFSTTFVLVFFIYLSFIFSASLNKIKYYIFCRVNSYPIILWLTSALSFNLIRDKYIVRSVLGFLILEVNSSICGIKSKIYLYNIIKRTSTFHLNKTIKLHDSGILVKIF